MQTIIYITLLIEVKIIFAFDIPESKHEITEQTAGTRGKAKGDCRFKRIPSDLFISFSAG